MTINEMISVLQAHKDGKIIECKAINSSEYQRNPEWFVAAPFWDFAHYDYRVAPEPRKPREFWLMPNCSNDGWYVIKPEFQAVGTRCIPNCIRVREVLENEPQRFAPISPEIEEEIRRHKS